MLRCTVKLSHCSIPILVLTDRTVDAKNFGWLSWLHSLWERSSHYTLIQLAYRSSTPCTHQYKWLFTQRVSIVYLSVCTTVFTQTGSVVYLSVCTTVFTQTGSVVYLSVYTTVSTVCAVMVEVSLWKKRMRRRPQPLPQPVEIHGSLIKVWVSGWVGRSLVPRPSLKSGGRSGVLSDTSCH